MKILVSVIYAMMVFFLLVACARPWQTARTGLEITNQAAIQTDAILAEAQQPALDTAQARVEKAYERELNRFALCREATLHVTLDCHDPGPPDAYLKSHYDTDEGVQNWRRVAGGVQAIKGALITADDAVTAWKNTKEEPGNWPDVCDAIHTSATQTTRALEELEVDVPPAWKQAQQYLSPLCRWVGSEVQ